MKKLSRQNGSGWAQEVRGTFVKVLMDPVSGKGAWKKCVQNFYTITKEVRSDIIAQLVFCKQVLTPDVDVLTRVTI